MDTKSGEMNNLLLFEKSSNPFPRLVTAKKQCERKNWFLYNGFIHELNPLGTLNTSHILKKLPFTW